MAKVWAKIFFHEMFMFSRSVTKIWDLAFLQASSLKENVCENMFIPALKTAATHLHHQIFSQSNVPLSLMYSFFLPHRAFYPRYLYTVLSSNRGKCQGNTYLLGSSSRFLLAFTVHCTVLLFLASIYCTLYVLLFLGSIFTVCIAVSC